MPVTVVKNNFPLAVQIKAFNLVFKIFDEFMPKTTRAKFNHSKKHLFEPQGEKYFVQQ